MPFVYVNRAKVHTTTTGTGDIALGDPAPAYQSFTDAGIADGYTFRYLIEDGINWEVGTATYVSDTNTLQRSVEESSNADAAINLSGSAYVYAIVAAADIGTGVATTPGGSTTHVQFNDAGAFGGSASLTWDDAKRALSIGTRTIASNVGDPHFLIDVTSTAAVSNTSRRVTGMYINLIGPNSSTYTYSSLRGFQVYVETPTTLTTAWDTMHGGNFWARNRTPFNGTYGVYGIIGQATHYSDYTLDTLTGMHFGVEAYGTGAYGTPGALSGNITNVYRILAWNYLSTAVITNAVGIYIDQILGATGAVITNNYGLMIDDMTVSGFATTITNGWNIYSKGATSRNYFQGYVGIGITTPSIPLHVVGNSFLNGFVGVGTAALSTAQLALVASTTAKSQIFFNTGVAPSSPNNGDLWFDGSDLMMRIGGVTVSLNDAGTGGTPAGSDTYVQVNNAGAFGADYGFTYDMATGLVEIYSENSLASNNAGTQTAFNSKAYHNGTGTLYGLYSGYIEAGADFGAGNVTNNITALYATLYSYEQTISQRTVLDVTSAINDAGTVTTNYGVYIHTPYVDAGGTITTNYGLYIGSQNETAGTVTTGWNIYSVGSLSRNYFQGSIETASYIEMGEISSPSTPGANKFRLYAEDDAGKTAIMIKFPSGATERLAVDP